MNGERVLLLSASAALPISQTMSAQAGSRPGGRPTFLWQQESRQRSAPRLNAARCAHGPLRCSTHRVAAELALASLGAQTVLATAALRAPEPDASVLLGVSEGDRKVSTINRCRLVVARTQAACRNPGYEDSAGVAPRMVLTFGSRRERRVAQRDREEGRGLSEHRAKQGRVPQAPGRASNAGKSGARHLTANAGRHSLLTFWCCCQKVRRPPGAGTQPTHSCALTPDIASPPGQLNSGFGLRKTQPNLLPRVRLHGAFANSRRLTP